MSKKQNNGLLTRDQFRELALARDKNKCVWCLLPATEVHHIIERKLFPDSGYYLDNATSVCNTCHWEAERTEITPEELREAAKIKTVVLPPGFDPNCRYTKWGDIVKLDGTRKPGPLFGESGVQKVIARVRHLYVEKDSS